MIYFWVQRYGVFRIPTIARLWHFIYQGYGIKIKVVDGTCCLSTTYAIMAE